MSGLDGSETWVSAAIPENRVLWCVRGSSASSELGCAGLDLIRRYALHVRDSGAADSSSLRESRRAAGLTEEKREERREQREGRLEKREEKRMNIITDMRK